ncbi:MAG TPA: hypothetical protein VI756_30585, partial [Blastocatellia bacterium]
MKVGSGWIERLRERCKALRLNPALSGIDSTGRPSLPWLTKRKVIGILSIFALAFIVRALCWQDRRVEIARRQTYLTDVVNPYRAESVRITREGGVLLPDKVPDAGYAKIMVHPPGYSFLLIALGSIN